MSPPLHFIACPLAHSSVYSTSLPHDWLLHVPTNLFPSIWAHSFSLLLQLYAQLDKLCVYIGGFIPSFFYYCNIHSFITAIPLPQSTFLSSFLRVQCILYIENIPRQVMISSYKVRHQQHLHRHQHWSVVGTWTTVSSTDKIPMRGYRHDIVYRLHPTHRSPSHYLAQVSLVDIPSYWSIYQ